MWLHLRRQGHDVARCTVERLMTQQGWQGRWGEACAATIPAPGDPRPSDLVDRTSPRRPRTGLGRGLHLRRAWSGTVYVAFIIDVYSRRIVGWRAATTMSTELVFDSLEHAIWAAHKTASATWPGWSTTPTPAPNTPRSRSPAAHRGRRGRLGRFGGRRLRQRPGRVPDRPFKTELIRPEGPWRDVDTSSWRPCTGSTGSTTTAPTSRSTTSHPSRSKPHYAARKRLRPAG